MIDFVKSEFQDISKITQNKEIMGDILVITRRYNCCTTSNSQTFEAATIETANFTELTSLTRWIKSGRTNEIYVSAMFLTD